MWSDAVGTFKRPLASVLGIQKVCLGFKRIHRNVYNIFFFNLKTLKKIKS